MFGLDLTNTKRELLRLQTYARFYGLIALVVFVVFGLLGVVGLSLKIKDKLILISEMKDTNSILQQKVTDLDTARNILTENKSLIEDLYKYLPEEYTVQDYLFDLTTVASLNRFRLDRVTVVDNGLAVVFEGSGYLPDLVTAIEEMPAVTEVKEVTAAPLQTEGRQRVNIFLELYKR